MRSTMTMHGAKMPQSHATVRAVTSTNTTQNRMRDVIWSYAYKSPRHTSNVNSTLSPGLKNIPNGTCATSANTSSIRLPYSAVKNA